MDLIYRSASVESKWIQEIDYGMRTSIGLTK